MAEVHRLLQILYLLIPMALQTITGTAVERAPIGGAPANMDALMAPARAQAQMGQAIAQAGTVMGEFAVRAADARNRTALVESEMTMEKAFADYQIEMSKEPDEEKWVTDWQAKSQEVKQQLLADKKLAPVVKNQLTTEFKKFEQDSTIRIGTQANVRTTERQKARLLNVADFMWKAGDYKRGEIAIQTGINAGLFTPEEGAQMLQKGAEAVDVYAVKRGQMQDPIATQAQLTEKTPSGRYRYFTNLDDSQRAALNVETTRRVSELQTSVMRDLEDRRNNGEIIPQMEMQGMVERGEIKSTTMKRILAEQKRSGTDPQLTVAFAQALRDVDGYNPNQDPTQEKFATLVQDRAGFTADQRQELEKRLNVRLKPLDESNGDKTVLGYIDSLLDGNFLGNIKKNPATGKPMNAAEYQAAYGRNIELRQQLAQFLGQNPKATPVQQRDFINSKLQAVTSTNAGTAVLNAFAGQAQTNSRGTPSQGSGKYKVIKVSD
jgi:hypothetical protein